MSTGKAVHRYIQLRKHAFPKAYPLVEASPYLDLAMLTGTVGGGNFAPV